MQGKQGPPPRCGICYLQKSSPQLIWQKINAADLADLEQDLQNTARTLASLPPQPGLDDFSRGASCSRGCVLARAGLCKAG